MTFDYAAFWEARGIDFHTREKHPQFAEIKTEIDAEVRQSAARMLEQLRERLGTAGRREDASKPLPNSLFAGTSSALPSAGPGDGLEQMHALMKQLSALLQELDSRSKA